MELTRDEIFFIHKRYRKAPLTPDGKLILKVVKFMPRNAISLLCYWVDPSPFHRLKPSNWVLENGYDAIRFRGGLWSYHIHTDTCNVYLFLDGRLSTEGNGANAIQYYMKYNYAFPVYFDKGHPANGKTPFELGIAIPDEQHLKDALNILYNKDQSKVDEWFFDKKLLNINLTDINIFEQELTKINNSITAKR